MRHRLAVAGLVRSRGRLKRFRTLSTAKRNAILAQPGMTMPQPNQPRRPQHVPPEMQCDRAPCRALMVGGCLKPCGVLLCRYHYDSHVCPLPDDPEWLRDALIRSW